MMKKPYEFNHRIYYLLFVFLIWPFNLPLRGQDFLGNQWGEVNPSPATWSADLLKKAEAYNARIKTSAVMVISGGKVVASWGDEKKKFMCHSIRKSFLSVLYGIYVDRGVVVLDRTLEEIGINDKDGLTEIELTATTSDLLKAQSGIYHPAAYESSVAQHAKPKRGTYKPGEAWLYNNWDFNALSSIFEYETGIKLFEAFDKEIAQKIGMQDFDLNKDTYYHFEKDKSVHPAYPFEMTARDMARFGWLILNKGNWNGQQIVSEKWIKESTTSYSESGYGYMWWISEEPYKMISANGVGGHSLDIFPDLDLVIVIRTNTYRREGIFDRQADQLRALILKARK